MQPNQTPTDESLMAQVTGGDLRKLALLFERYHRPLFNFFLHMTGRRELSEDLVQEVFFRILRYRHTYDGSRRFSPWMYQIARNLNNEKLQERRTELRFVPEPTRDEETAPWEPASPAPLADETLRRTQETQLLQKALHRLPPEKREVLVLSRFQNLSYAEIARVLGCEEGNVKVRVFRAVRALGQIYSELSGEKVS
jgi:RNA polymerase sigma factor (sigma-70 family)